MKATNQLTCLERLSALKDQGLIGDWSLSDEGSIIKLDVRNPSGDLHVGCCEMRTQRDSETFVGMLDDLLAEFDHEGGALWDKTATLVESFRETKRAEEDTPP